ncbi:hypothetical protein C8J57DRAFT_224084 [Mycena rebaudengoi]|nr:hypothetical protein C8J57DRAFT_224084 [Mycena rebaudengoi]
MPCGKPTSRSSRRTMPTLTLFPSFIYSVHSVPLIFLLPPPNPHTDLTLQYYYYSVLIASAKPPHSRHEQGLPILFRVLFPYGGESRSYGLSSFESFPFSSNPVPSSFFLFEGEERLVMLIISPVLEVHFVRTPPHPLYILSSSLHPSIPPFLLRTFTSDPSVLMSRTSFRFQSFDIPTHPSRPY